MREDVVERLPTDVTFRNGVLTLVKSDRRSAVFAVTFELEGDAQK